MAGLVIKHLKFDRPWRERVADLSGATVLWLSYVKLRTHILK